MSRKDQVCTIWLLPTRSEYLRTPGYVNINDGDRYFMLCSQLIKYNYELQSSEAHIFYENVFLQAVASEFGAEYERNFDSEVFMSRFIALPLLPKDCIPVSSRFGLCSPISRTLAQHTMIRKSCARECLLCCASVNGSLFCRCSTIEFEERKMHHSNCDLYRCTLCCAREIQVLLNIRAMSILFSPPLQRDDNVREWLLHHYNSANALACRQIHIRLRCCSWRWCGKSFCFDNKSITKSYSSNCIQSTPQCPARTTVVAQSRANRNTWRRRRFISLPQVFLQAKHKYCYNISTFQRRKLHALLRHIDHW